MNDKPEAVRKGYPILGSGGQTTIDWQLVLDHAEQAYKNHSQSVLRLAERGGLSWDEMLAVLTDRSWRDLPADEKANAAELCRAIEARYLAALATPAQPDASALVEAAKALCGAIVQDEQGGWRIAGDDPEALACNLHSALTAWEAQHG